MIQRADTMPYTIAMAAAASAIHIACCSSMKPSPESEIAAKNGTEASSAGPYVTVRPCGLDGQPPDYGTAAAPGGNGDDGGAMVFTVGAPQHACARSTMI